MKQETDVPVNVSRVTSAPSAAPTANRIPRKRPVSGSKDDDTDWVLETPKRSRPSRSVEVKKEEPM